MNLTEQQFIELAESIDDGSNEQMFVDPDGWLRDLYKALKASPASAPEGWKLVPVEPTQAMSEAAMSTFIRTSAHETEIDVDVLYHAMLAAAPTPPENKALLEAVAEVVWYDPSLSNFPEKPGKIIDGSIAFMESAEIGTKLFAAPVSSVSEDRKDAERYLWLRASDFDIFGSPHAIHLSGKELDQAIDAAMQEDKL